MIKKVIFSVAMVFFASHSYSANWKNVGHVKGFTPLKVYVDKDSIVKGDNNLVHARLKAIITTNGAERDPLFYKNDKLVKTVIFKCGTKKYQVLSSVVLNSKNKMNHYWVGDNNNEWSEISEYSNEFGEDNAYRYVCK